MTGESGFGTSFGEELEGFFAESLKFVGRGAGFVRASAKHAGTGVLDGVSGGEDLFARFDGAGSGNDDDFGAAYRHVGTNVNDRTRGLRLTTDQFVRLGDSDDGLYTGRGLKSLEFVAASAGTDRSDDGFRLAASDVGLESGFANAVNYVLDFVFRGTFEHVHNHCFPRYRVRAKGAALKSESRDLGRGFGILKTCAVSL